MTAPERTRLVATIQPAPELVRRPGPADRVRLVAAPGRVEARGLRGGDQVLTDVEAVLGHRPGNQPRSRTGAVIGLRRADGERIHLELDQWVPWPPVSQGREHLPQALASTLGVPLEPIADAQGPTRWWRPRTPPYGHGFWWARAANAAGAGLLIAAILLATGPDRRDLVALLLSLAAALSLVLVAAQWLTWWRGTGRRRRLHPGLVTPEPATHVDAGFVRRAGLAPVDGGLLVRQGDGREWWFPGPDDELGVREAVVAPVERGSEQRRVTLRDQWGGSVLQLDADAWFGTPSAWDAWESLCSSIGVATGRRDRPLPVAPLIGDHQDPRASGLRDAGLGGAEAIRTGGLALIVAGACVFLGVWVGAVGAAAAGLGVLVPGVLRVRRRHLDGRGPR